MGSGQHGGEWITVKTKSRGKNKDSNFDAVSDSNAEQSSEKGKRNGPGRHDRSGWEHFTESSAYTESSSRTSRSASPSNVVASKDSTDDHPHEQRKKKPKTRRHKTSPGQISMTTDDLLQVIATAKDNYPDDSVSQLGVVTDFFVTHYSSSEFPFNKTVLEQPLEKVSLISLKRHFLQFANPVLLLWGSVKQSCCEPWGTCGLSVMHVAI